MTASLDEQIRSLAAASLEPPTGPTPDHDPSRSRGGVWVVCAAVLVAVVVVAGTLAARRDTSSPSASVTTEVEPTPSPWPPQTADLIGQLAPPILGTAIDGTTVDLESYRGRWVVVHAFASWCEPCRRDLPDLVEVARARPDVQFLTLIFDDPRPSASTDVLDDAGVDWPVLETTGDGREQVLLDYRITGLPETIVIDPDGIVHETSTGSLLTTWLEDNLD